MRVAKSQIYSSPLRAMAGLIKCKCCDATMVQISTKGGGFYGCSNAKRESCDNKKWLSRMQVKAVILNDLKEKFLTANSLKSTDGIALNESLRAIESEITPISMDELLNIRALYHITHTSIQTVALLGEEYERGFENKRA